MAARAGDAHVGDSEKITEEAPGRNRIQGGGFTICPYEPSQRYSLSAFHGDYWLRKASPPGF